MSKQSGFGGYRFRDVQPNLRISKDSSSTHMCSVHVF